MRIHYGWGSLGDCVALRSPTRSTFVCLNEIEPEAGRPLVTKYPSVVVEFGLRAAIVTNGQSSVMSIEASPEVFPQATIGFPLAQKLDGSLNIEDVVPQTCFCWLAMLE